MSAIVIYTEHSRDPKVPSRDCRMVFGSDDQALRYALSLPTKARARVECDARPVEPVKVVDASTVVDTRPARMLPQIAPATPWTLAVEASEQDLAERYVPPRIGAYRVQRSGHRPHDRHQTRVYFSQG